jgi:uncharacterized protein (TIGR03086 family)
MNVPEFHRRACERFGERVHQIGDDQWHLPTPCSEWDVRTLVNHVAAENLWTPPLMEGRTIDEVGDRFEGDILGDDPKRVWDEAAAAAIDSVQDDGAMERTVHLSFGDFPGSEYASQLFADHLIHSWDLSRGIGAEDKLDPELVEACTQWFVAVEEAYRAAGAIGPRPEISPAAGPQTRLLAMFGRLG